MTSPAAVRIRAANAARTREDGDHVLYWMTSARRTTWNFGLQRAVAVAEKLGKPLLVLEALRRGYRWRSDRIDAFVIAAMADHAERLAAAGVLYHPYVEPAHGDGRGLVETLAARACLVVTDEFPTFFLPRMLAAVAPRLPVRVEAVDSNGLLPMAAASSEHRTAYAFRRFLQRELPAHLAAPPRPDPLAGVALPRATLPAAVLERWPAAMLPKPTHAAERTLAAFLSRGVGRYSEDRNEPAADATSGLAPHLHFGHVAAHDVFARVAAAEGWSREKLSPRVDGKRSGWWGMSAGAEEFLDQFVTWRELGFGFAFHREDHDRYESLPDWARRTLEEHAEDPRPHVYSLDELDAARTHDPIWNAAQTQLVREGRIHNYLRMLWGKKVLEWSPTPRAALDAMIEMNNAHALDGRDPNSYSGIFWVMGRFDRPWGPERPIYGTIRYMTSANTARKYDLGPYLARYGGDAR